MPSTYTSSLRLVLPATGELSNTWGTVFNAGATSLIDNAIAGTASITMTAADYTLSNNNGVADESRSMFLVLGGTPGASYNVICPAVSKLYFVTNNTGFAQTVKTASGTGISVPNGARMALRCDGTNVVEALNYLGSLTLGSALPVGSGGTGAVTLTGVLKGNGTSAFTASNVSLTSEVTGTLPVANGGTGLTTYSVGDIVYASGTGTLASLADVATGNALISGGVGVAPSYGKIGLTTHVSGTLGAANGGTGVANNSANTITFSGAFGVTFTLTNTTSVTLPTSGTLATLAGTETLTNKRITQRVNSITDAATITPTGDSSDQYNVTALAQPATVAAPSGTPTSGQKLILRLKDNGTARALTWTTSSGAYRAVGVTLPTTTTAGKTTYIGCIYNSDATFWDVVAVTTEA